MSHRKVWGARRFSFHLAANNLLEPHEFSILLKACPFMTKNLFFSSFRSSSPANVKPRHGARRPSLEDAKRELDSEAHKLNKFVKQLRSSKNWLDQRERKIYDFEALLRADVSGSEFRPDQQASTGSTSEAQSSFPESSSAKLRSLEAMQQVIVQYDGGYCPSGSFLNKHDSNF